MPWPTGWMAQFRHNQRGEEARPKLLAARSASAGVTYEGRWGLVPRAPSGVEDRSVTDPAQRQRLVESETTQPVHAGPTAVGQPQYQSRQTVTTRYDRGEAQPALTLIR